MITPFFNLPSTRQLSSVFDDDMFSLLRSDLRADRTTPNVTFDIMVRENDYLIKAEIPGMKKEDIKVNVDGNTLIISGEKKRHWNRDEGNIHREESRYGWFQRSINLPCECDANALKAKYENGVLELTCKKLPQDKQKGKSIQVV